MPTIVTTTSSVISSGTAIGAPFYLASNKELFRLSDGTLVIISVRNSTSIFYSLSTNDGESWSSPVVIVPSTRSGCSAVQIGDNFVVFILPTSSGGLASYPLTYNPISKTFTIGSPVSQATTGYSGGTTPIVTGKYFDSQYWLLVGRPANSSQVAYYGTSLSSAWSTVAKIVPGAAVLGYAMSVMSNKIRCFLIYNSILYYSQITKPESTYVYDNYTSLINPVVNNGRTLDTICFSDTEVYVSYAKADGIYIMRFNGITFETPVQITNQTNDRGHFCIVKGTPIYIYVSDNGAGVYGISYVIYKGTNTWSPPVEVIPPQSDYNIYYLETLRNEPTSTISICYTVSTGTYRILYDKISITLGQEYNGNEGISLQDSFEMIPKYPWWNESKKTIEPACCYCAKSNFIIEELEHLEGQVVAILANGKYLGEQVVVEGKIDLGDRYSKVNIGIPFESELETLKINLVLAEGSTIQGTRIKVNNVTFHLRNSKGGQIGPNESYLYEAFSVKAINQYSGKNLGDYDLYTGKIRMPLSGEYEYGGHILIRQRLPIPLTIGSIIPEVDIGGITR